MHLLVDDQPVEIVYGVEYPASKTTSFSERGSTAIIRTCRQIYHEAVGVLYGQNVFEFTYRFPEDHIPIFIITHIEVRQQWTQDIGSSVLSLRNITIDLAVLDVLTETDNPEGEDFDEIRHREIKILPLLDILWNGFARNLSVRFECSDRDSYAADLDLKSLDKALHELGKMDSLNLKKTSRLLWIVEVVLNGTEGTVCILPTSEQAHGDNSYSWVSFDTWNLLVVTSKPALSDLPYNVMSDIA